ncbi:hypothetical protein ETU09_00515 [Apibacter muscae]|uniref:DUF5675 domain-containing protein n=1 Tax=Apibacter muscae TaxID=2509004 RepID=A0A563DJV6_9FLAO|nr:DUF5675 family protein [Apibacter muscae]TWP30516.1 hypothetical protein ETU09_00515 [Apibacter muscae]
MKAVITRKKFEKVQTLGELELYNNQNQLIYKCKTLELPWKNNQLRVSCIPEGIYQVNPRTSAKFKKHFHVVPTEPRSYILIHAGNYYTDIQGCILVGTAYSDINKDGYLDVVNSKVALNRLLGLAPKGFELIIKKG